MLELADKELSMVTYAEYEGVPVAADFYVMGFDLAENIENYLQIDILGYLYWNMTMNNIQYLSYCEGRFIIEKSMIDENNFSSKLSTVFESKADLNSIIIISKEAYNQIHGTTVIVSSNAENEANRLCGSIKLNLQNWRKIRRLLKILPRLMVQLWLMKKVFVTE